MTQIAGQIVHAGETLPLIVGSHRAGAFRCSSVWWVTNDGNERISTFYDLRARVDVWDGRLPAPNKITSALRHARKEAEQKVQECRNCAVGIERANLAAQRSSAALRLEREMARLLACLDESTGDLHQQLEILAARPGPLNERLRRAKELLGDVLRPTEHLRWELRQFLKSLTPNDRKARVSGSSIDAAFADYRWGVAVAGKVSVTIGAQTAGGIDQGKLNNGVLEPLREADVIP